MPKRNTIAFKSVRSTNIKAVGYDIVNRELHVQFVAGSTYKYYNVPKNVYESLIKASSVGSYFAQHVKSHYSYEKL